MQFLGDNLSTKFALFAITHHLRGQLNLNILLGLLHSPIFGWQVREAGGLLLR